MHQTWQSTSVLTQGGLQEEMSNEALKGEAEASMHMHASCSSVACDARSNDALSPGTVCPISSVMARNPMPGKSLMVSGQSAPPLLSPWPNGLLAKFLSA